jgi:cytochrome c-type biogenesis protein CcmF
MSVLGSIVLDLALVSSVLAALLYVRQVVVPGSLLLPRRVLEISSVLVGLASALLLVAILRHDYSLGYVYGYSDNTLQLSYLLSTFYAGQEGSFLFWTLCMAILALLLRRTLKERSLEAATMSVFLLIQSFLLIILLARSPFRTLWEVFPTAPATVPLDGRGLNPLLQNFWMVIHPPILFVGFAAMTIPFALAVAGLWTRDYTVLVRKGISWTLAASSILGLGIMLGAYWAYGVLGWGGYWGWDPVENSSLVPWLVSVGLIHTMLAQLRTGKYVRTNFVLSLLSFALVVYSTFLTRSGILGDSSVHAFTDPGASVYWLLIGFLGVSVVGSIILMALRFRAMRTVTPDTGLLTRESSLAAGMILLVLSAAAIAFGTSLPIFSAIRPERTFYDTTNLPIIVLMAVLIGYSLYTQWEQQDAPVLLRRTMYALIASLIPCAVLRFLGVTDTAALLVIGSALFALLINVQIGIKVMGGDIRFIGGKIAHIGIALFLIGVIASGRFETKENVSLPQNQPREVLGHRLTYTGYSPIEGGKYAFHVNVEWNGRTAVLSPVMFETGDQGLMRNPDIASSLTRDFYISPVGLDQGTGAGGAETYTLQKGEDITMGDVKARFLKFDMASHDASAMTSGGGLTIGSVIELHRGKEIETVVPSMLTVQGRQEYRPQESRLMQASIVLVGMNVSMGAEPSSVTVEVRRDVGRGAVPDVLVVEASTKPFIGFVWGGTVVMLAGFILAILKRTKEA